jgi:hypothetical protein
MPLRRSLVDSVLVGVIYASCAAVAAPHGCIETGASKRVHRSLNGTDHQDRMATRQERIGAFTHDGVPPADQPFELLCEDHVGTYVIPFLCRWQSGAWQSVATNTPIEATVVGWRAR